MSTPGPSVDSLGRFRGYLRLLAEVEIGPRLRRKLEPSDLVQETLLKACQAMEGFQGENDRQLAAWLRRILARKLADALRDLQCGKRDFRRECSLEEALERSSVRLQVVAVDAESPSTALAREERLLHVADAIAALPEKQRRALILKHWHGWSLAEIAEDMEVSIFGVAGLLRRAMSRLREDLRGTD